MKNIKVCLVVKTGNRSKNISRKCRHEKKKKTEYGAEKKRKYQKIQSSIIDSVRKVNNN